MTGEHKPHETGSPSTDENATSNKQISGAIAVKSVIPKHR